MKLKKFLALAFLTVACLPLPTFAQPAESPDGAPSGDSDDDISRIDGVPVKVGERNEYHYNFKRSNVSTNPLGWVLGLYGVSASYALTSSLVLRADANYYSPTDTDRTGYELGVAVPLYFRRAYQGFFLEPGMLIRSWDGEDDSMTLGPYAAVGWHWIWDSGLNVAFAGGLGRKFSSDNEFDELYATGYLRFGYAF